MQSAPCANISILTGLPCGPADIPLENAAADRLHLREAQFACQYHHVGILRVNATDSMFDTFSCVEMWTSRPIDRA